MMPPATSSEQSATQQPQNQPDADLSAAPAEVLLRQATAFQLSQAIWVATKLSVADHLRDGPQTIDRLASITGCDPAALHRLLRALAAFQIFRQIEPSTFALAPQGACLRSDAEDSIRDLVLLFGGENFWQTWGALLHSVRTGDTAFSHLFGVHNSFEYYVRNPGESESMNHAMTTGSLAIASAVVAACDFSAARTIADIGGGHGRLIAAVLEANAGLRGILFDFAGVVAGAAEVLDRAGVADRCDVVAGDMRESVPAHCDIYLMSRVLNIFDDDRAVAVLNNCRAAMAAGAKLIVLERVLPEIAEPTFPVQSKVMSDLNMLVRTGGRERTANQFHDLLAQAGLRATRIVSTAAPISVIEAVRA